MVNRQFGLPGGVVWVSDGSAGHHVSKPDDRARFGRVSGTAALKDKTHEILVIKIRLLRRNTDWMLIATKSGYRPVRFALLCLRLRICTKDQAILCGFRTGVVYQQLGLKSQNRYS